MEHDHFTQVLHISRSLKLGAKKKVKFDGEMLAGSAELELKITDSTKLENFATDDFVQFVSAQPSKYSNFYPDLAQT